MVLVYLIDSIFGGVMIGVGAMIYCNYPTPIGAFVFSIGLLSIFLMKFKLYTGAIGFVRDRHGLFNALYIFVGNIIGSMLWLIWPAGLSSRNQAELIWNTKLNTPNIDLFIKAIICGLLIFIATIIFRTKKVVVNMVIPILCVMAFIMVGAEHSIADLCYMFISH